MLYTYSEGPMNEDRAAWACAAVRRFAEVTRHDGTYIDDVDGLAETVQDLLGDMLHLLCQSGVPLGPLLLDALGCFAEERAEEEELIPEPVDALRAVCASAHIAAATLDTPQR